MGPAEEGAFDKRCLKWIVETDATFWLLSRTREDVACGLPLPPAMVQATLEVLLAAPKAAQSRQTGIPRSIEVLDVQVEQRVRRVQPDKRGRAYLLAGGEDPDIGPVVRPVVSVRLEDRTG